MEALHIYNSELSYHAHIRGIEGGLWGLRDPPKSQKSQKETPPETPLKSSGIATTLKSNSNPPKNFGYRPRYA